MRVRTGQRKRWDPGWLRSGSLWGKWAPDFDGSVKGVKVVQEVEGPR